MKKITGLLFAAILLAGCSAINPYKKAEENIANTKQLRVGMTKAQALAIMGEPLKNESFNRPDVWFYYFETNWLDGLVTEDECFPLVFENGKLIGWGNSFYSKHRLDSQKRISKIEIPDAAGKSAK
jgi:outer membrane protein assembly factor BamE (lipoprotein component of BamABCDE complex)